MRPLGLFLRALVPFRLSNAGIALRSHSVAADQWTNPPPMAVNGRDSRFARASEARLGETVELRQR
jgi:hypothetical protein